jgi:hypothetical protein
MLDVLNGALMRTAPQKSFLSLIPLGFGAALAIFICAELSLLTANASETDEVIVAPLEDTPVIEAATMPPRARWVDLFVFGDTEAQRWAAERIVTDDTEDWPDDYRGDFLHKLAPGALVTAHRHHIPPSVTIAQAVLESGWGRSSLAHTYNNLFGVKAMNGHPSIVLNSAEIKNGVRIPMRLRFAVFESWDHAIEQHGVLLTKGYYDRARRHWTDWRTFVKLIAPVYASDPNYASRIGSLINRYGLDRWDDLVVAAVDMAATAPDELDIMSADAALTDPAPAPQ